MTTRINFSQNIPKPVPAHKLDDIEEAMLNTFNNSLCSEDLTPEQIILKVQRSHLLIEKYGERLQGIGFNINHLGIMDDDEFNKWFKILDSKINENNSFSQNINLQNDNKSNIIEVDTFYDEIDYIDNKLFNIEIEKDNSLNDDNVYEELHNKYDFNYVYGKEIESKLENIYIASKLGYQELCINTTMNVFEKITKDFNIDYNYISLKENNNIYVLYNEEKEVENVDILDNDKNIFPKLNKIDENKKIKKSDISLLSYRIQLCKYKKIKNNFYNKIKDFYDTCNKNKEEYKKSMELFDAIEKEVEEDIKKEKEEQLNIQMKKIYEKLKENNNIELKEDNNIYKLINKLEKQKVEKLYILSDIGKELVEQNIENESKFLEQFKDNDIYYIYDLKNKNKISRFINMCNKLYLLKDKIKLDNIIKNNLLTSIRDLSQNNFTYLLNLF